MLRSRQHILLERALDLSHILLLAHFFTTEIKTLLPPQGFESNMLSAVCAYIEATTCRNVVDPKFRKQSLRSAAWTQPEGGPGGAGSEVLRAKRSTDYINPALPVTSTIPKIFCSLESLR